MNVTEAMKKFDQAQDLIKLDRATIKEIVQEMSDSRTKGSITFHFDGQGDIMIELDLRLKGDAVKRYLTERKI